MKLQPKDPIITTNRKAYHDYFIEDTYEAGVILSGCEIKSIREGTVNLKDSYIQITRDGKVMMCGAYIAPYSKGSFSNTEPRRDRILLLNKTEIRKLRQRVTVKGYTLIPTKLYFKQALVKVEVALCRGKQLHDKRDATMERDLKREADRERSNLGNF